ncbi:MAG TPA: DNA methyltransferase, partial [Polyangia bacterium]
MLLRHVDHRCLVGFPEHLHHLFFREPALAHLSPFPERHLLTIQVVRFSPGRSALLELRRDLEKFRVLDPACGSGNFLYVAYRELVRLEMSIVQRLRDDFPSTRGRTARAEVPSTS